MIDTPADRPRALVVYESMFGCTEQVTRAVAAGLEEGGCDVDVRHVRDTAPPRDLDFDIGPVTQQSRLAVVHARHAASPALRLKWWRSGSERS